MSKKEAWCWPCTCWHPEGNNTHSKFKCRSKYRTLWLTVSRDDRHLSPEVADVLSVQPRKKAGKLDKVKTDPWSMRFTMSTNLKKVSYEEAKKMLLEAATEEIEKELDVLTKQLTTIREGRV